MLTAEKHRIKGHMNSIRNLESKTRELKRFTDEPVAHISEMSIETKAVRTGLNGDMLFCLKYSLIRFIGSLLLPKYITIICQTLR